MTNREAVIWLINITADIGKIEHQKLWHYEQALSEIREMLETEPQRMKGKWIVHYECPKCGELTKDFTEHCPFCGTDMRGN